MLQEGIALDIFFTTHESWGLTYAIRTGPAEFSHKVLARGWASKGLKSIHGFLTTKDGVQLIVEEKIDLFKFLDLPLIKPENRA